MWPTRFDEYINLHECHSHEITETYESGKTSVQPYQIVKLGNYGRAMIINGHIQSTEKDEYIYHESLIYPAYVLHPDLKRVLCLGGANGGMLRELRKMPKLEAAELIDIDSELCELSKIHLPHMHCESYKDPRFSVQFGNPRQKISKLEGKFDAVFADLPDATIGTDTSSLFTQEFYFQIKDRLRDKGIFVTQAGAAHHNDYKFFANVVHTLKSVFRFIAPYSISIPSYGIPWGFVIASDDIDVSVWNETDIACKLSTLTEVDLRSYDATTHRHMFSLPKVLREVLARPKHVISDEKPAFTSINVMTERDIVSQ